MRYFFVNTLGDLDDRRLCILDKNPEGIGVKYSRLCRGRPIESEFPRGARIHMSPDRTGLKLASLIGNTSSFLILHHDVKDAVAAEHVRRGDKWRIEYLPFTLIDREGRPCSSDYFLVNPIGGIDCVNR